MKFHYIMAEECTASESSPTPTPTPAKRSREEPAGCKASSRAAAMCCSQQHSPSGELFSVQNPVLSWPDQLWGQKGTFPDSYKDSKNERAKQHRANVTGATPAFLLPKRRNLVLPQAALGPKGADPPQLGWRGTCLA